MTGPLMKAAWIAGAVVLAAAGGDASAQEDREQRIQDLEDRIRVVEAQIWINKIEDGVRYDGYCQEKKSNAKSYYDRAAALNEANSANPTVEYQRQITELKARNQEEIAAYKDCYARAIGKQQRLFDGQPSTYSQFQEFSATTSKRLGSAPEDLEAYLAELKAELNKLLKGTKDYVGKLDAISGAVSVSRGAGPFQPASRGLKLYVGDVLRTGPGALALVVLPDEVVCPDNDCGYVTVEVSGDTEIRVAEFIIPPPPARSTIQAAIDLIRGAIRSVTKGWGNGSIFNVRAGTTICGIRGTDIAMQYDPAEDRVEYLLKEGTVEIKTAASGTKTLNAGQMMAVKAGTAGQAAPLTDTAWSAALAATGDGALGPPLQRSVPATAGAGSAAAPAAPGPRFGAVAYSRSTGIGAMTKKGVSQEDAQKRVLEDCRNGSKAEDCRLLIWFENGCGAFAREKDQNGPYGADWAESQPEADAKALAICAQYGGQHCEVIAQFCTQ